MVPFSTGMLAHICFETPSVAAQRPEWRETLETKRTEGGAYQPEMELRDYESRVGEDLVTH